MIITSFVLRTISIYCDRGVVELSFEVRKGLQRHTRMPSLHAHVQHWRAPLRTSCTPPTAQVRKELYSTVQYILSFASCFAVLNLLEAMSQSEDISVP